MNSSPQIRPADEGVIGTSDDGRAMIRFERRLDHSPDRVWQAVTEPAEMQTWLAYRARVDLRVGGSHDLWLGGSDSDSEAPVRHGTITQLVVGSVIEVGYDDGSTLRWEVHPGSTGARLVFTDVRPHGARAQNSVLAGWHIRVDHLPRALDGVAMDWEGLDRDRDANGYIRPMAEIYWHYRNRTTRPNQHSGTNEPLRQRNSAPLRARTGERLNEGRRRPARSGADIADRTCRSRMDWPPASGR